MKTRISRLFAWLRRQSHTDRALLFLLATALLYLAVGAISGGRTLSAFLFDRGNDLFMDYFNSLRDAAQGERVYTERRVIYPPMANLIFLVLSYLVPPAYRNTAFAARHTWRQYPTAILSLALFLAVPLALTALVFNAERRRHGLPRRALLLLLCNVPLLYLVERGNMLLLTLPALLFFLYYKESQNAWLREGAYLALAFAVSVKLYPALLVLFLLARRRLAATCRVLAYSATLILLPSLAFGGIASLRTLLSNILSFTADKDGTSPAFLVYLPFLLALSLFTLSLLRDASAPLRMALAGATLFVFPALHAVYAYVFLLAPLPALLAEHSPTRALRIARLALLLPLALFPLLGARGYLLLCSLAVAALLACAVLLFKTQKNTPVN